MFSKSSSNDLPSEQGNPAKPQKSPAQGGAPSIISSDVQIQGNMSASGEVQLDGSVEGDVHCTSLTLGDNGRVKGSIHAETVIVRGTVAGQINARSIRLEKTSRVKGDLYHETISVEAGAIIEGHFINSSNTTGQTRAGAGDKTVKTATTASKSPLQDGNGKDGSDKPGTNPGATPTAAAKDKP